MSYIDDLRKQQKASPGLPHHCDKHERDSYMNALIEAVRGVINKNFHAGEAKGYVYFEDIFYDWTWTLNPNVPLDRFGGLDGQFPYGRQSFYGPTYRWRWSNGEVVYFPNDQQMMDEIRSRLTREIRALGVKRCDVRCEKHQLAVWEERKTLFGGTDWKRIKKPGEYFFAIYIEMAW